LGLEPAAPTDFLGSLKAGKAHPILDAAYSIHHVAGRFGSELALWQTIAERNPSLTLTCVGNGTYSGCQILAEQAGFTTVVVTETQVIHCEIPNAYFGPWLHRAGLVAEERRIWDWNPRHQPTFLGPKGRQDSPHLAEQHPLTCVAAPSSRP
jgi:hypothetical protein